MGYSIDWSDLEQRIQDQKAALLDTSQNMDPERLKFLVETYDECKGESVFITRAKLFEKVLNNKKIYLDGNPIVGSGWRPGHDLRLPGMAVQLGQGRP